MRKLWFLLLIAAGVSAQTINPNSQITWPRVTGSGAPTGHILCPATINNPTNATVGTPYTDTTGPHYWQCTAGGWFQVDGAGGNITDFKHNGALLTGQFATNPQIYDYDESVLATPGYTTGTFHADTATGKWNVQVPLGNGLAPLVTAPAAGQYVILYPHTAAITRQDYPAVPMEAFANGSSASGLVTMGRACSLSFTNTVQWSGYTLADYPSISAGDVTAVYAFAVSGYSVSSLGGACFFDPAPAQFPSVSIVNGGANITGTSQPYSMQQVTSSTGVTGATISSATATASITLSGQSGLTTALAVNSVGLIVYYTGTAVTSPSYTNIAPPLTYDIGTNTLGLDPTFPRHLYGYPIANIPNPSTVNDAVLLFGTTDCITASGNPIDEVLCKPKATGITYVWQPMFSGGGSSATYFTETVTCTSTCTLAHTPTTFLNLARNGLVQYYTSDFTQSGATITLVDPAVSGDSFYAQYYY